MSVFVKLEKFGSANRFLRFRGLSAKIGEDIHGILTQDSPHKVFFTIYKAEDKILLNSDSNDISFNGDVLAKGSCAPLSTGSKISINDYVFTFFLIPSEIEALAHTEFKVANLLELEEAQPNEYPQLSYSIAFTKTSYTLCPQVQFMIGSAAESAIYIPFPKIEAEHAAIMYNGKETVIAPLNGCVIVEKSVITKPTKLTTDVTIQLAPTSLEFTLSLPKGVAFQ